ncbi:hypothetical protein ED733_008156 [Metarhizium rileyi]|uniref:Histone H4 n=1 Tax=Metarhizium rileyi (strain RCEF 4871) TaxID=1649241 RepID=A0A5C6GH57_METRR|nr:hypothetical protein ED733_008156 [Metarhizium rileyi]
MPPTLAARGGPQWPRTNSLSTPRSSGAASGHGHGKSKSKSNGVAGKTVFGTRGRAVRHRKILRDTIMGITKPAIRRLARRGGVKRISADIYGEVRTVLKQRLELLLGICVVFVEHRNAKTVTVDDVLFALRQIGRPIYGFDFDSDRWS